MVMVGFHNYWLNDIDYIRQSHRKEVYKNYKFPLAVSIIITGMYEDDLNNADDVVYTGRGGHNLYGNKPQIENQVLLRGNLELKGCGRVKFMVNLGGSAILMLQSSQVAPELAVIQFSSYRLDFLQHLDAFTQLPPFQDSASLTINGGSKTYTV